MALEEMMLSEEEQKQLQGNAEPEPAPEATTPPVVAPEPTPPPVVPPAPEKVVPLAALHEERERYRALKQSIEDFKKDFIAFKEAKQQPPAPPLPSFDEDPLGYMKQKTQQVDVVQQRLQEIEQQNQALAEKQAMAMNVHYMEQDFRSKASDYDKAVAYMSEFRRGELQDLGVTDPNQIQQILSNNAIALAQHAFQNGQNPAELIYNMAKRYGYKPAETPTPAPAPLIEAQKKMVDQQMADLQAIEKGQQTASKTLSGGAVDVDPSLQALADTDDPAEFNKLWNEMFKRKK